MRHGTFGRISLATLLALAVLAALPLVLAVPSLDAQPSDWSSFGPTGGHVFALAVDPEDSSTLYAGTRGGPFKSTAGGLGWRTIDNGIGKGIVRILAISPADPSILYAATSALSGLYRSRDGGETWEEIAEELDVQGPLFDLVTDPLDASTLYFTNRGFYRSFDGGETWETSADGTWSFEALAISPARPERLLATTWDDVYASSDRGATWRRISRAQYYDFLAVDSFDPDLVYAANWHSLYRSTDAGRSWSDPSATTTTVTTSSTQAGVSCRRRLSTHRTTW